MANKRQKKKNAKKLEFDFKPYESKQRALQVETSKKVQALMEKASRDLSRLASSLPVPANKRFSFKDNPGYIRKSNQIIRELERQLAKTLEAGIRQEWSLSTLKNDALMNKTLATGSLSKIKINRYLNANDPELDKFVKRRIGGMNLNERVRKYAEQFKQEVELSLSLQRDNQTQQRLQRDIAANLKKPKTLFQKFKNKFGQRELNRAQLIYRPGQGTYRSSVGNLQRMIATELRQAFNEQDSLRIGQSPFIVGYRVRRSSPHAIPCIVCDSMVGLWPKTFRFTQFHPSCQCICTPVFATNEEIRRLNQSIIRGESIENFISENSVDRAPDSYYDWVQKNKEKILTAKNPPQFLKVNKNNIDNLKFIPLRKPK